MRLKSCLSLILLLAGYLSFAQKKNITVKITYKEPYCGGARPSEEMLEKAQLAKPYAKKKVVLVSDQGKTKVLKTDTNGEIKTKLKAGTYKIYEAWRYTKKTANGMPLQNFDSECLKLEWQKEIFLIKVGDNISIELKNEIILSCPWAIPCILDSFRPELPN